VDFLRQDFVQYWCSVPQAAHQRFGGEIVPVAGFAESRVFGESRVCGFKSSLGFRGFVLAVFRRVGPRFGEKFFCAPIPITREVRITRGAALSFRPDRVVSHPEGKIPHEVLPE
jgi:hypothetical protein